MDLPFAPRGGGVEVRLPAGTREALADLLRQLDGLLDDGTALPGPGDDPFSQLMDLAGPGPQPRPATDPAVARLLPDAHADDPELAAEFRRLTESGLRARKRTGALRAADALTRQDPVVLGPDEALALLKAMTDLRLVLGERLGLRADDDVDEVRDLARAGLGEPEWLAAAGVYENLTELQEALVITLDPAVGPADPGT